MIFSVYDSLDVPEQTFSLTGPLFRENGQSNPELSQKNHPDFPFPLVPLTPEEESNSSIKYCFKFQTSTYVAYVSMNHLAYLKPEYLESLQDSFEMREARKWLWGKPFSKEAYALEGKYPYEQSLVLEEKHKMENAWMADHADNFLPELIEKYNKISNKYTRYNFIWENMINITSQEEIVKNISDYVFKNIDILESFDGRIFSEIWNSLVQAKDSKLQPRNGSSR